MSVIPLKANNQIRKHRKKANLSLEALAQRMQTSKSQVHKLERGERRLTVDWMVRLAAAMDCQPYDLLPPDSGQDIGPRAMNSVDLPVYGPVEGYSFAHRPQAHEFTARPSNLVGAIRAYGLYMDNETMIPRFYHGDLLYIKPDMPVTTNSFALIEQKNGGAMVVQVVRSSTHEIVVRQFNPAATQTLAVGDVRSIQRVVGAIES